MFEKACTGRAVVERSPQHDEIFPLAHLADPIPAKHQHVSPIYPPIIKHDNGKSPMNGGSSKKITAINSVLCIAIFDYRG